MSVNTVKVKQISTAVSVKTATVRCAVQVL